MKFIAKNRRANYDYDIERTLTAGLVVSGPEAKSLRLGLVSLKGSFAHIKNGELWLFNAHISAYPHATTNNPNEPTQVRKLLVSKRELKDLMAAKDSGRSIVPLAILGGRYVKVELGIGKGKKRFDKRQTIKQRDTKRNIERDLSAH